MNYVNCLIICYVLENNHLFVCSNIQFQGYDGVADDCSANISDDDIIKKHGSSLSSYADLLEHETENDNFVDFKFKQPTDGVPLVTVPFHETANREIKLKQRQQPTEGTSRATLPFQGTANRRIRLNWQHKKKPTTPVEESGIVDDSSSVKCCGRGRLSGVATSLDKSSVKCGSKSSSRHAFSSSGSLGFVFLGGHLTRFLPSQT